MTPNRLFAARLIFGKPRNRRAPYFKNTTHRPTAFSTLIIITLLIFSSLFTYILLIIRDLGNRHQKMNQLTTVKNLAENYNKVRTTLELLSEASTWRDQHTSFHEVRVGKLAEMIALEMGISAKIAEILGRSSCFHDIGKFGVPEDILRKTGALTGDEYNIVKEHSLIGATIFKKVKGPFCRFSATIALTHHEKMDGSGYPKGLTGHQIPLQSRIVAVADVYDALRSTRNYKDAMPHEQVIRIMFSGDDRTRPEHFDETVLKAFEACIPRLPEIYTNENVPQQH
jgi:HD-GYP domain-containing protein (c-di-GMP phosphodiesterase class II)